ncbi:LOW QUALITY PROTEIN: valine--tRNA ligase, mitochondrial-like, partial [Neolamprologus brichardi]|uniref:LOW QUALITY PROTEIN: valine--tRNA ligase, mitochondrial-like n=1 Tax=Neolamprologus brichardi TaxID=32507 RepID=UPI001643AA91
SAEGEAVKWSEKQKIAYTAPTPPGAKKDTSSPFPSCYSPEYVESSWYQWWEREGFFSPEQHVNMSTCYIKLLLLQKGDEIYHQLRKLGASLDWSRACFTMDPGFSRAVTAAFVRLCDSGLIYRSEALVSWSCALESAISDIEVDWKELSGRTMLSVPGYEHKLEFGAMLSFAYPVEGHDTEVVVSTTRPETMLGDVAIAVHPDDPRYQTVHGKLCRHPFTDRLLPIITDSTVDVELGTGAVKVTPAHDHADFVLSQRHSLPRLTVIAGDGTMTAVIWYYKVIKIRWGLIIFADVLLCGFSFLMLLPSLLCFSRSGDIIEPLLRNQWFVRCDVMAQKAVQAVEERRLEIIPEYYTKTWKNWLSNISDWCISRQLWWGHQIPAYKVMLPNYEGHQEEQWVWGCSEDEARHRAAVKYGLKPDAVTLTRDPDVLDTWFSSALFPFAMLGWPDQMYYSDSPVTTAWMSLHPLQNYRKTF